MPQKVKNLIKLIFENAFRFLFNVGFVYLFQFLFGMQNTLAGVAIGVALTLFPVTPNGIGTLPMAGIIVGLFTACGLAAQLALVSPWLALPLNFLFVALIMLLTCEPLQQKPSITFLLCFVFCQATPVPAGEFPVRLLACFAGGAFVAGVTALVWRKQGFGKGGRTLWEQLRLCSKNRGLILRMAAGIAIAMLVGMLLHLKKPLWISIVVMSLTQLDFSETIQRIKHRMLGTVLGIALFILLFRVLVPPKYAMAAILALGYLSFFTSEYKYKQIVNAVNAINASLVLLDTSAAIWNRILCLLGGIGIVLALFLFQKLLTQLQMQKNRKKNSKIAQVQETNGSGLRLNLQTESI